MSNKNASTTTKPNRACVGHAKTLAFEPAKHAVPGPAYILHVDGGRCKTLNLQTDK